MDRDRNLLFGVFAVQLNKVSAIQLMEAAGAWAVEPSKGIPERLVAARALSQGDRDLIQRFVDEAVAAHDGNAGQTLKSFGGDAQVHRSYRGSIVLTPDGQVSIPPTDVTPHGSTGSKSDPDLGSIKGVFETPGRYTNAIEHARGGMGRVLLVHDDYLGRDIALKELLPHLGEVEEATTRDRGAVSTEDGPPSPVRFSAHILARFLQEARITGQLEHPSIVPVYELGHRADGSLYYTMKLVRGRSLSKGLGECNTLEERLRYLPHFVDLCQAIAYAHSRKIIHRDIKPANVMVGEFGETVVLDWGLAKRRDREDVHQKALAETILAMNLSGEFETARTAYGQVLGTPVYMPPEQAKGDLDQVDEQSDVYSLGAVLYEILTGKLPFEGKSTREVLNKVIAGDAVPVSAHIEGAPPELVAIAAKAMRKEKERRYDDVKALAEEVQRFQSGALVGAYTYTLRELFRRYTVRHKALVVGSACAAVALLALFSVSYWRIAIERDQAQLARQAETEALNTSEQKVAELVRASYVSSIRLAESHLGYRQPNLTRQRLLLARQRLLETPAELRNWEWGNLYLELDSSKRTVVGHSIYVNCVAWSPNGQHVVTASDDGTAKVWNVETGEELCTFSGHRTPIHFASWSPNGKQIVTASEYETVKVWNAETGVEILDLAGHEDLVSSVNWSPDGKRILTSSSDKTAKLWDGATGGELQSLAGHRARINTATWSPDGGRILTASLDHDVKIWDAETGRELWTLAGHTDNVTGASWRFDGNRILTASADHTAKVWDPETGEALRTLPAHSEAIISATWSPDGSRIATASSDGTVKLWTEEAGTLLWNLSEDGVYVSSANWSPDGGLIATTSGKVWDADTGEIVRPLTGTGLTTLLFPGPSYEIFDPVWSPDGTQIVTATFGGAKIWEVPSPEFSRMHGVDGASFSNPAFSPDGNYVVSTLEGGTCVVHDVNNGEKLISIDGVMSRYSWSPDGNYFVGGTLTIGTAKVWEAKTGEVFLTLSGHEEVISATAWSPDGRFILTVSYSDGVAKVWSVETGEELRSFAEQGGKARSASWSPDGQNIVTTFDDNTARVWAVESGKQLRVLGGHKARISSAAWSPDSDYIVTTSGDTAKVWSMGTGENVWTLTGHNNGVLDADWSPDGRRIVTASHDRTAKVWDAESGEELRTLAGHQDSVEAVSWSSDGRKIVTIANDGRIKIWSAAPWSPDAGHTQEMVDRALWVPDNDHKFELDYRNIDESLGEMETMFQNWSEIDSAAPPSFTEIPGIGISVDNPNGTQVVDGIALEKDDLIVRVNSKRVDTMRSAAEIGQSALRRYQEAPDIAVSIRFDIVRNYGLETYSLFLPGTSKQDFPIKRGQALQLFQAAENLVNRDSARYAENGEDIIADREVFLSDMAGPLRLEKPDRLVSLYNIPIKGYPSLSDAIQAVRNALEADTVSEFYLVVYRDDPRQWITVRFIVER